MDVTDVEEELEKRMENIYSNDCCVLVYTVRIDFSLRKKKLFPQIEINWICCHFCSLELLVIQKV